MADKPATPWPPGSINLGVEIEAFTLGRLEELKIPAEERTKLGIHALLFALAMLFRADNKPPQMLAELLREMAKLAERGDHA